MSCRQTARDEIILDLDVTWAGESDIQVRLICLNFKRHQIPGESERHASVCDGPLLAWKSEDCLETTAAEVASSGGNAGINYLLSHNFDLDEANIDFRLYLLSYDFPCFRCTSCTALPLTLE